MAYPWPTDFLLPLSVSLAGGEPLDATDRDTVRGYERGNSELLSEGAWFDGPDEAGPLALHLYPAPAEGLAVELEWVYRPTPMESGDSPDWLPEEFHPALLYEVAADYYERTEDNPELAQRNSELADKEVAELLAYGQERAAGNGVFLPAIVGWTQ